MDSNSTWWEGWVEWNVTNSFKDQFANGKEYGWVLMPTDSRYCGISVNSREYSSDPSLRPELVFIYGPPTVVQSVSDAKLIEDHERVSISGKIASSGATDFTGFFYMQESDRCSGIRVVPIGSVPALERGKTVSVEGTMATFDGERQIAQASVVVGSDPVVAVDPLGLTCKSLGGGTLGSPPNGQAGVQNGTGLNNIGLLVKAWGEVVYSNWYYTLIDDGSDLTVRVDTSKLGWLPSVGSFLQVVGISSIDGTSNIRYVLPRDSSDVE